MRCPKCGREYPRLLALSREDNKTMICDECGMREALEAIPKMIKTILPEEVQYGKQK